MLLRKKSIIEKDIKYHTFRGSDVLKDFFDNRFKGTDVLVYFDPDVDGLISGLFACKSLMSRGISFSWYINSNRAHGFFLPIDKVKGMNLFCVDFVIDEVKLKELVDAGCNVLSIDHHDNGEKYIEYESNGKKGIVINNQYLDEEETGRYLSGAGVVYESLLSYFGEEFDTRENRALVGLTLLTDVRDIENINARLYLQDLYTHPYKGYIKYLIDGTIGEVDYNFGVPRMDRNFVDYTFSPTINSCLRFNKEDYAVEFILGSGKMTKEYHTKQKELVSKMKEYAKVVPFDNINVVIIDDKPFWGTGYECYLSNFVGLLASQYLDGSKSAISYLVSEGKVGRASFRGRVNGVHYLSKLSSVLHGIGHGSAFGIIGLEPSKELFLKVSNICKEKEDGVDFATKHVSSNNLSILVNTKGYDMGIDNIYCLSQNRKYIKYTGNNIKTKRTGAKFKEYSIDGVSVLCFDNDLDPRKDYIMPIIERGVLCFYLNKKDFSY